MVTAGVNFAKIFRERCDNLFALLWNTIVHSSKNFINIKSMKHLNNFKGRQETKRPFVIPIIILLGMMCLSNSTVLAQPCQGDDNAPVFTDCSNKFATLGSGECATFLNPLLSATDDCNSGNATASSNPSPGTITSGHGCNNGVSSYVQIFNPSLSRPTEIEINSVTLGVGTSQNNPLVIVRIYITDGTTNIANWEVIGGGAAILPNLSLSSTVINVVSTSINPTQTYAIEVETPIAAIFGTIMGINNSLNTTPTYYWSPSCGANVLVPVTNAIGAGNGIVVSYTYTASPVYISNMVGTTLNYDGQFPEGVHNLGYIATDASGNSSSCTFTFTVNGPAGIISSIACNDLVNISMDDDCEIEIQADEILEGGPYGCYDVYEVELFDQFNQPLGNIVTASDVGKTYTVKVTAPNSNSCWGLVKIEDKLPPVLQCDPIYTTCFGSLTPGSAIAPTVTFESNQNDILIPSDAISSNEISFEVFGLNTATITDVDVILDIEHSYVSELRAQIIAPDGTSAWLFTSPGTNCSGNNLQLVINDQAPNNYSVLQSSCDLIADPAISGSFKSQQSLSVFNGKNPNGTWIINVLDQTLGEGGYIRDAKIAFKQTGGKVAFPSPTATTFTPLGNNNYIVNGIDPCGPVTAGYIDEVVEESCFSIYSKVIKRTWSAFDASGNSAIPCDQYIYVYRNGLSTLQFPPNYDGIQNSVLSCFQYGTTVPGPNVTGSPSGDFCSNVQVFPYVDIRIDICEKSYKILRQWKVLEWCSSTVIEHTQVIKVLDNQGPVMNCPSNVTVSADALTCTSNYSPPKPVIISECSTTLNYDLSYYVPDATGTLPLNAIFIKDNVVSNTTINGIYGKTYVRWIVTDNCGNSSSCTFLVTVTDQVRPVAVCDQYTKVSLGSDGIADVDAISFDDGSHDNCSVKSILARKMTNLCPGGTTTEFREQVRFCCLEIGPPSIMVEVKVTDEAGNSNTCMVEIKVEDKLPPYITLCPPNITLNCDADYLNLAVTGEPVYIDNCKIESVNFVDSGTPNQCGVGVIFRTWTVKDRATSDALTASCVQRITLLDLDPFSRDDIQFPPDYDASTCNSNLDPSNLPPPYNEPKINDDVCSLTSSTYKDQIFTFVDGACMKIIRTWTVIDWCTYNVNTGAGLYSDIQIIKLTNNIDPVFANCSDVTVDVFGNCQGEVTQTTLANDDCTPQEKLKYSYVIDLYNDGIPDPLLSGTGKTFSRVLPIGKHKITWKVEDNCTNYTYCTYILTVRDGKKPTPYCLSHIATVVMPSSGDLTIWAKDFDLGSYDNCTPKEKLKFSFTSNTTITNHTYDCEDIPDGISSLITVEMWVTDEAGNQDFCTVTLNFQDGTGDACPDNVGSRVSIGGKLSTVNNKTLTNVDVQLMDSEVIVASKKSTTGGNFMINNVSVNKNYELEPRHDVDLLNGVSTLDLVQIQRHILAMTPFNSPLKIIASDINNDEKVTVTDLVALRKVILGVSMQFPNGQKSWRFVPAEVTFADPARPFPVQFRYKYNPLLKNMFNQDFTAIKMGDVNGTVVANAQDEIAEPRSSIGLTYKVVKVGTQNVLHVYGEKNRNVYGMQLSLKGIDVVAMDSGLLPITSDNYNVNAEGQLLMSWSNSDAVEMDENTPLFSIILGNDSAVNPILTSILSAELYTDVNEVNAITLTERAGTEPLESFVVYQNVPNPFSDITTIGFKLPQAGKATLTVSTVDGKVIYTNSDNFAKGMNYFTINQKQLGVNGMLHYQIESGQYKATKKMVSVK